MPDRLPNSALVHATAQCMLPYALVTYMAFASVGLCRVSAWVSLDVSSRTVQKGHHQVVKDETSQVRDVDKVNQHLCDSVEPAVISCAVQDCCVLA